MKRLFIAIPFFAAAVGCTSSATDTRPPISELKPGLNMIDIGDPSWGVDAAYVKDGHVVYLEQRLGAMKPQVYRDNAPEEPANEIDMRFVDETGKTFFVQRGGDQFVDPSWATDVTTSLANPAPDAQRVRDFVMAREAAGLFAHAAPPELKPYSFNASAYAERPAPSEDPEMIKKVDSIEASRPDEAYGNYGFGGSWWFEGDLYSKSTSCVFWYCPAKHSGVALWAYQTTWQLAVLACNHGSCPGQNGMGYNCYSTSGVWRDNVTISAETNGSTSIGGGCLTGYSWDSGGYNHLCNDDSAYELWQIKNGNSGNGGSYDTNGDGYSFIYNGPGTGGDGSWVNYACTCAYNNGCNNDWSRPICP